MPATTKPSPPRRWFQFRLRTLLIAVAVLAVPMAWVAYSLRWIEERQALLANSPTDVFKVINVLNHPPLFSFRAPGGLWLLGERAVDEIYVVGGSPDRIEQVTRLFPEAKVVGVPELPPYAPPSPARGASR